VESPPIDRLVTGGGLFFAPDDDVARVPPGACAGAETRPAAEDAVDPEDGAADGVAEVTALLVGPPAGVDRDP
jgi:hypothetical protein